MQLREEHQTALVRGIGATCIAGALGFLYGWTGPESMEARQLIGAAAIPFLTTIGGFFGFSVYDARRNDGRPISIPLVKRGKRRAAA